MVFAKPEYDLDIVDLAGNALIDDAGAIEYFDEHDVDPLDVIANWRLAHAYPLNTFQMSLRQRARSTCKKGFSIVAQRIKRVESIEGKLRRKGELRLSVIQDIGGCRAIVPTVEDVYRLAERYKRGYSSHRLDDYDDYIRKPKPDGYRGYHLIYCYSDPNHPEYENLKIEMQLRTGLQHGWATAVETVDTFLREGLKSHRGSPDWRRFFALAATAFAFREGTRHIPRTPTDKSELVQELRDYVERLRVFDQLESFQRTLDVIPGAKKSRIKWVVLELDPAVGQSSLRWYGYRSGEIGNASAQLEIIERHKSKGVDAVLVSVDNAMNVRNAYPNYWLDTSQFLAAVREAIS